MLTIKLMLNSQQLGILIKLVLASLTASHALSTSKEHLFTLFNL